MKTKLIRMSVFAVVTAAAVYAQNPEGVIMKGTIPFDFVVGSNTLPAGQYTIARAFNSPVLVLKSAGGQVQNIVTEGVESVARPTIGQLVFHTYGKQYFLAEVWTPGDNSGRQLHMTSHERELAARPTVPTGATAVALANSRP